MLNMFYNIVMIFIMKISLNIQIKILEGLPQSGEN